MFGRATIRLGIGPHSSVRFCFSIPNEEILQNDLFCVEWDVRPEPVTMLSWPGWLVM